MAGVARELGLDAEIVEFEQTTRTAEEAAAAIGCEDVVWAAAGTLFAVFAIAPDALVHASNGIVVDLKVNSEDA